MKVEDREIERRKTGESRWIDWEDILRVSGRSKEERSLKQPISSIVVTSTIDRHSPEHTIGAGSTKAKTFDWADRQSVCGPKSRQSQGRMYSWEFDCLGVTAKHFLTAIQGSSFLFSLRLERNGG